MKRLFLTFIIFTGLILLSGFSLNKETKVQAEVQDDCWTECCVTTCGTLNCHCASSGLAHYELAVMDDEFDCSPLEY